MAAAAVPLAMAGGGALLGKVMGKSATNAAMQRSPEERQYLGAQTRLADMLSSQGGQLFKTAMPGIQSSMGYYQKLLHGDRATMTGALAPERAEITDSYAGAQKAIERTGARGGERDAALTNLANSRAGAYSRLA